MEESDAKAIQDIVRRMGSISLSNIHNEYARVKGSPLSFQGKLKLHIERIPNCQIKNQSVVWVEGAKARVNSNAAHKQVNKVDFAPNSSVSSNLQFIVKACKRIDISLIQGQYIKRFNQRFSHDGKLKDFIAKIPNIRLEATKNQVYAIWNGPTKNDKSKVHEQSPDASSSHTAQDAMHDTVADIITFEQSISGKALTENKIGSEVDLASKIAKISSSEPTSAEEMASTLFGPTSAMDSNLRPGRGLCLFDRSLALDYKEGALFGHFLPSLSLQSGKAVYLNTHEPFCFATIGVQGAGKSHTSSCVLESCLVPFESGNVVKLNAPMTSMVLHFDQNITSICESAGLLNPNRFIKEQMNQFGASVSGVPKDKAVILVSPTFYRQRKKFYGDYCIVKPLLFRWTSLTADHIKRIMRIENDDNQLYVASFLDLLRGYQRQGVVPDFPNFLKEVRQICSLNSQKGPLDQRLTLLESMVAESEKNASLVEESLDLFSSVKSGYYLMIADLTDPLLSKGEANGLFQVLTEQFRTLPTKGGKVLFLDEAHKYMSGVKSDGLSEAIVNVARLMRHDGMRLVVSTQSPKALAPELLELVTIACLHHFHSPDWWAYLQSKLPVHDSAWERILSLRSGDAIVFATSHNLSVENVEGSHCLPMRIRPRITEDLGSSRRSS